jgi:ethanolamine ammonia-lyase large subunit
MNSKIKISGKGLTMGIIAKIVEIVSNQTSVVAGAIKMLTDLRVALGDAIDAGDMAALEQIRQDLDANTQALADALIEGTEAAPGGESGEGGAEGEQT